MKASVMMERIKKITTTILSLSAVTALVIGSYGSVSKKFEEEVRLIINDEMRIINERIDELKSGQVLLFSRVDQLTPVEQVAIFDMSETRVIDPCYIGNTCKMLVKVKRTPFGEKCLAPDFTVWNKDRNNVTRSMLTNTKARRVSVDWEYLEISVIPDIATAAGIGYIYLDLSYKCLEEIIPQTTSLVRVLFLKETE